MLLTTTTVTMALKGAILDVYIALTHTRCLHRTNSQHNKLRHASWDGNRAIVNPTFHASLQLSGAKGLLICSFWQLKLHSFPLTYHLKLFTTLGGRKRQWPQKQNWRRTKKKQQKQTNKQKSKQNPKKSTKIQVSTLQNNGYDPQTDQINTLDRRTQTTRLTPLTGGPKPPD